ncbi:hypothetical protein CCM_08102 [Cordyceps militaris CM01]|uniref:Uncharacterized protein n=1 Tax=Cordyceps militaris (strain CM01) TaxID=983644 RepID=G3JNK9_CORMM|nr:uncharacterized protein CCM_08102 [Cordyceps militaris CM01]EGX89849.1 hypothetical protein CCM_08102 [Cordyceps militaris CM01]
MSSENPQYSLWLWRTDYDDRDDGVYELRWFALHIGTPWGKVVVKASDADFSGYDAKLAQFRGHCLSLAVHPGTAFEKNEYGFSPNDSLKWVLEALIAAQGQRGPTLQDMTLKDFLRNPCSSYRIKMISTQDQRGPTLQEMTLKDFLQNPWSSYRIKIKEGKLHAEPCDSISGKRDMAFWTGLSMPRLGDLPPFTIKTRNWSDFCIRTQVPGSAVGDLARPVWLGDECYRFRPFVGLNKDDISQIIKKHQVMNSMVNDPSIFFNFQLIPAFVTVVHYVIIDDKNRVLGLAGECPSGAIPLRQALQEGRYAASKSAWKKKLEDTLGGMRQGEEHWMTVSLDSVLVREDEVWIWEFGAAYKPSDLDAFGGGATELDSSPLDKLFSDPLWGGA